MAMTPMSGGATGSTPATGGTPSTPGASKPIGPSAMSVALFDEATIVDFQLSFPAGEYEKLLSLRGPSDTRWVRCTFSALGSPAVNANCRRKGSEEEWADEPKPQLIIRFNLTDKQARFRGLRRFNLEAFDGTAAPVRDRLGFWLMRGAGLDAPRANHVRVFKDGQLLGLYQNVEAIDKEFIEDHFGADDTGNLWDGGEELKTNEEINDSSKLSALWDLVANEPMAGDHTAFFGKLDQLIDVPQFLRLIAAETVVITEDNFSNGSTNFVYYEHPKRGFLVLPWDLDTIFDFGPPDADLYDFQGVSSDPCKMRRLMLQNPAWKTQLEDDMVDIRDNLLAQIPAKTDAICAQIRPAIMMDTNRSYSVQEFDADCAQIKDRVTKRIAYMKQALGR